MFLRTILLFVAGASALHADESSPRREWIVGGAAREALVFVPSSAKEKSRPAPVVFAFHGHGGTMAHAAKTFEYQRHWPDAIVVYMQGLKTPGKLTDPEGKRTGWQHGLGDQNDRDLKFFDTVLASLKQDYAVDERRIYSTGHSNGGGFTYLLWAARGDVFAAVAPSASLPSRDARPQLKPKPVLHIAGENDELVKYAWQKLAIQYLRQLNQCEETGEAWAKHCQRYASKTNTPVYTFITIGTHKFPDDAPPVVVRFFKEQHQDAKLKADPN